MGSTDWTHRRLITTKEDMKLGKKLAGGEGLGELEVGHDGCDNIYMI